MKGSNRPRVDLGLFITFMMRLGPMMETNAQTRKSKPAKNLGWNSNLSKIKFRPHRCADHSVYPEPFHMTSPPLYLSSETDLNLMRQPFEHSSRKASNKSATKLVIPIVWTIHLTGNLIQVVHFPSLPNFKVGFVYAAGTRTKTKHGEH